jgi:N-methylhydantoinase A
MRKARHRALPGAAGRGCRIGDRLLRAPFGFEAAHSAYLRLAAFDAGPVNRLLDTLTAEAQTFARQGIGDTEPVIEVTAYMRYAGQGWEIPVEVGARRRFEAGDGVMLKERFEAAYRRFFGRPIEGLDAEIVSWSVRASSPRAPSAHLEMTRALSKPAPRGKRECSTRRVADSSRRACSIGMNWRWARA